MAEAYGMAAIHGDGNDPLFVRQATIEAATRARSGNGPTLMVFDTYRWREHCGPNYDNNIGYRSEDEFFTLEGKMSNCKRLG